MHEWDRNIGLFKDIVPKEIPIFRETDITFLLYFIVL